MSALSRAALALEAEAYLTGSPANDHVPAGGLERELVVLAMVSFAASILIRELKDVVGENNG